jgi:hypothetical protein
MAVSALSAAGLVALAGWLLWRRPVQEGPS